MSVSNSRHAFPSLFSSKSLGKRLRSRLASAARSSKRSLLLESLERRELMASDVGGFRHNSVIPTDVNGDFAITPIDALQVINTLNRLSRGEGEVSSLMSNTSTKQPMADVNNDGRITPIDALMVINRLQSGEGVGELAEIGVQVLNAAGNVVSPTNNGGVNEYTFAPGEKFFVRVRTRDIRMGDAQGVFGSHVDISYAAQNSPNTELTEVLWGEYNGLQFARSTTGGSFSLQYGSETTGLINYSTNPFVMHQRIQDALAALPFVGGASNVRVTAFGATDTDGPTYDISFVGSLARTDVPNASIAANNLTGTSGSDFLTIVQSASTSNPSVIGGAVFPIANSLANGSTFSYDALAYKAPLISTPGAGFKLDNLGNITNLLSLALADPSVFLNIFDVAYRAGNSTGVVDFTIGSTQDDSVGVLLYGNDETLPDNLITFPSIPAFRINIVTDLAAVDDTFSVDLNTAKDLDVRANDLSAPGTVFTITSLTQPASGTAAIINSGTGIQFTPANNFTGQTTFTYTVTNNQTPAKTSTATVTINVASPNNPPVPLTTALNATEAGSPVTFTPAQLFSPGAGESSQTVSLSNLNKVSGDGVFALVGGSVQYTPANNDFIGNVVFTVEGTDNGTPSRTTVGTFTVTVADVNDAPTVNRTTLSTNEDTPLVILGTDLFNPGPGESGVQSVNLQTVTAVSATGGTIVIDGTGARFTPAPDFSGEFIFTASGQDTGNPAIPTPESRVTITVVEVNDDPIARNDSGVNFVAPRISTQPTPLNVLLNDESGDVGDTVRVSEIVAQPASGSVAIGTNGGNVIYTPAADTPVGSTQSFVYKIIDNGGKTATATVQVLIDPPTRPFAVDDTANVSQNGSEITIDVLANDFSNIGQNKRLSATLGSVANGSARILDNGTPSDRTDDKIGFTPASGFTGRVTFTYSMDDTSAESVPSTGTITVNVGEQNDPPTARNQTVAGTEDTQTVIQKATIIDGATPGPADESGQTLTVTNAVLETTAAGTIAFANETITFTPAANFNGPALIRYTITDNGTTNGVLDPKSASATITIDVAAVNDAPTAVADSATTAEGTALTASLTTLTSNDSPGPANESTQTLSVVSVTMVDTAAGSIAIAGSNYVFTPTGDFNGNALATYVLRDSGTGTNTATGTITFTVTPVNDAPVPVGATRSANATIPITINLTAELAQASRGGGSDEATQTVVVSKVTPRATTRGTVSLNNDGTIRYVAPQGFSGADVFDYEITDNGTTNGQADPKSGTGQITINVAPFVPSTISGQVWVDDDMDGSNEDHEWKLGGIDIVLTGRASGASSDITPIRTKTSTNGSYSFAGLVPGTYVVSYTPPFKMIDAPGANAVSQTIVAPGGTNSVVNFSAYGYETGYNSVLDNLQSSYYLRNGQTWRQKGFTFLVRADGSTAWVAHHGGFEAFQSQSLRIASDGVYLRVAQAGANTFETKLARNAYIACKDADGNTLIRVLATADQLAFAALENSTAEGEAYLANVDRVYAEMGR